MTITFRINIKRLSSLHNPILTFLILICACSLPLPGSSWNYVPRSLHSLSPLCFWVSTLVSPPEKLFPKYSLKISCSDHQSLFSFPVSLLILLVIIICKHLKPPLLCITYLVCIAYFNLYLVRINLYMYGLAFFCCSLKLPCNMK